MFACTIGGHITKPHVTPVRVVTEIREREYPDGSKGWEIVSEENLCPDHAEEFKAALP